MIIGDVIRVRSLRAIRRNDDGKWVAQIGYAAPKGQDFVVLLLGTASHEEVFEPDKALNAMGWALSPELPAPPTEES